MLRSIVRSKEAWQFFNVVSASRLNSQHSYIWIAKKYMQLKEPYSERMRSSAHENGTIKAYDERFRAPRDLEYLEPKGPDVTAASMKAGLRPRPIVKAGDIGGADGLDVAEAFVWLQGSVA